MPTEAYVQRQFDDGMAVEKWLSTYNSRIKPQTILKPHGPSPIPDPMPDRFLINLHTSAK